MLIVNHYAAPLARRDSWLRRVEIYDNYAESPYTRMAEVLTQRGLDRGTVGFEKNYLSAVRWEEIRPSRAAGQYAEIFGPSDPCVGYAAETFSYQQPPLEDEIHLSRMVIGRVMWQLLHFLKRWARLFADRSCKEVNGIDLYAANAAIQLDVRNDRGKPERQT